MANYYIIYDKNTGKVLQTHASYQIGSDQAVACDEEEVLRMAAEDFGDDVQLAVARAPEGFDPSVRGYRLSVDAKTGEVGSEPAPRRERSTD